LHVLRALCARLGKVENVIIIIIMIIDVISVKRTLGGWQDAKIQSLTNLWKERDNQ